MKDTIKNSIIGAFAIFGLVTMISSWGFPTKFLSASPNPANKIGKYQLQVVIDEPTNTTSYVVIDTENGNIYEGYLFYNYNEQKTDFTGEMYELIKYCKKFTPR